VIKKPDLKKNVRCISPKILKINKIGKKNQHRPLFLPPARTAKLAASSEN
jgi:hypothetical protein